MSKKSVVEIADAVRSGARTARSAVEDAFAAIAAGNDSLNAFVMIDEAAALAAADDIDAQIAKGADPGPLAGVPIGVKDIEDCIGFPTTKGSVFLKDTPPKEEDSPHMARLRAAGAVPVGKTATAEFGMDSATFTKAWGGDAQSLEP